APAGAPATIDSGEVADLGVVRTDFEVSGNEPFGVTSFQVGSSMGDPGHLVDYRGDPAQSNVVAVEQYRKKYVFLAPDDYDFSFADVVAPDGAVVFLDGYSVGGAWTPVSSGHSVLRVELDESGGGAHVLECDLPCSLQVMGYGFATSYQYPGGLNTNRIAEPPFI
ncbi:MAG: hypothetical protein QME96_18240, partial [Myxococcota bacterium]|nr:hypothetical protein [Myxococcota bacterium]